MIIYMIQISWKGNDWPYVDVKAQGICFYEISTLLKCTDVLGMFRCLNKK